jgi:hypothetical protein
VLDTPFVPSSIHASQLDISPLIIINWIELRRVKVRKNILHTIKRRKANWIGHILSRNCLVKHSTEGKIEGGTEVTGRQGNERIVEIEATDHTLWRTRFARGYGTVIRRTTE